MPHIKDAYYVMSSMVWRNSSDQLFEEAFCLDGALMTTSLNCFAGRNLMRNSDKYVMIISLRSKADAVFPQTRSVKDMKKIFLAGKNGNEEIERRMRSQKK